ncbi:MAG: crotonase/enoyl-CoA hydratase family protein [Gammaproteobacteria bacterium]|jgi:enoyl-CoA hydratase/carnithine racemase|nr:crotonase/enoyl-CoA hydratase family protein [Gammaproteobacteria bacterium]
MSNRIDISIENHVAEVMLNRPEKLNALDLKTFEALDEAARTLDGDKSVRAVVLHGAGENFCAGIDLSVLQGGIDDLGESLLSAVEGSPANRFQRAAYAWRELPVPVICALQGVTFGGGFQIAMGADLRYAARDTQFSIMESKWGLIPDMAISTTLRHIVPPDLVKELAWTARVFDAKEALQIGVLTSIEEDPLAVARRVARECADKSPDAIRGIKRLVNEAWSRSEEDSLVLEAQLQLRLLGSGNQAEAVRANLENRKPNFTA